MLRFALMAALALALLAAGLLALAGPAHASHCLAYVEGAPRVMPAAVRMVQTASTVEITYVGHSTFRIETPGGVTIATDFTGNAGPGVVPTVATMNHAHETHYTDFPDPRIEHVLRGWNPQGGPAKHDLDVGDVHIRNVPTDIRGWSGLVEPDGNSIFIFEVADLCIGHLGHLHHRLSDADLALIGRLDVVFAPVDGSYTLALPAMIDVLEDLKASLIVPMHFFGGTSLRMFVAGMRERFAIRIAQEETIRVSLANLPAEPTVLVPKGY